jgi:hypothetical protein
MDEITTEILQLVKKKMKEQGAYSRETLEEIIDETILYFQEKGKLDYNDNEEFIKNQLFVYFNNYLQKIGK